MRALLLLGSLLVSLEPALSVRVVGTKRIVLGWSRGTLSQPWSLLMASPEGPGRGERQLEPIDMRAWPAFLGEKGLEKREGRKGPDLVRNSLYFWAVRRSWELAWDQGQAMTFWENSLPSSLPL